MDEATEQIATVYVKPLECRIRSGSCVGSRAGRLEVKRAVGSLAVVVLDVDAEDMGELAPPEDEEPVEAFAAHGADPALHVGVRVWRSDGCADDRDVLVR
jgi:hypothetical protein